MYYDLSLKFKDEAEANAVLFTEWVDADGIHKAPKYAAIDIIGAIYKATGRVFKNEDGDAPEMAPVKGWHVNVRHTAEMPELQAWVVVPKTPDRVWA
jgi:hypothetical protein